ncbi:insulinase family protein [Candidatus Woesearchaeota archaeon]|nr:insulinase family protein [Candidatus Woesearchaeota archaeon]
MPLDQAVIQLLERAEFSQHIVKGARVSYNRAESARHVAYVCFTRRYETSLAAQSTETLLDLYLRALLKGTSRHPSSDALTRAFRGVRVEQSALFTDRNQDLLTMGLPLKFSSMDAVAQIFDVVDEMLSNPRAATDGSVFENVRKEHLDSIEDRIGNHDARASTLFFRKFFPQSAALEDEDEKTIVKEATFHSLQRIAKEHLSGSAVTLLYSGHADLSDIVEQFLSRVTVYGHGTEALPAPEVEWLPKVTGPVHECGPSQQMQFIRAYPLEDALRHPEDWAALKLVNQLLGGSGWTSPLMQIIREKHHLVYGIRSLYLPKKNVIFISTSHEPAVYTKIVELMDGIVADIAEGSFSDDAFGKAKAQLLEEHLVSYGHGLSTCDQPDFRVNNAYNQFVRRAVDLSRLESYRILAAVQPSDARHAAQRFLDPMRSQIFTYSKSGNP